MSGITFSQKWRIERQYSLSRPVFLLMQKKQFTEDLDKLTSREASHFIKQAMNADHLNQQDRKARLDELGESLISLVKKQSKADENRNTDDI